MTSNNNNNIQENKEITIDISKQKLYSINEAGNLDDLAADVEKGLNGKRGRLEDDDGNTRPYKKLKVNNDSVRKNL